MASRLYKKHLKRMRIVVFVICCLMVVLSMRTLYVQLIKDVDKNIIGEFAINGKRGVIYDRNGKKMAYDVMVSDIILKNCDTPNKYEIANFISENFEIDLEKILNKINNEGSGSLKLVSNVNDNIIFQLLKEIEEFEELEVTKSKPGRYYPQKALAFHILGKSDSIGGKWGVEKDLNDFLIGKKDLLTHFILNTGKKIPAYDIEQYNQLSGKDVILTIDLDYQRILSEELLKQLELTNSEHANGVIIDVHSGEILAMTTLPSSDLNKPLKKTENTRNRTINHSTEPGSTIKTFSLLAGLDNNIIKLSDKVFCEAREGQIGEKIVYKFPELNNRSIEDHEGRDTITVKEVLAYSSNIGTVKLALKIGKYPVYNTLKKFGFGSRFNFDFLKDQNKGVLKPFEEWDNYSLSSIPIGQEMRSNNLQLAMAYSAIANGGYLLEPKLIRKISNSNIKSRPEIIRKVANNKAISNIVEALKLVVEKGTASKNKIDICYYGKTGTAQVFIQAEEYFDNNGNNKWDDGEEFIDIDQNGKWTEGGYSNSVYIPSFASVYPCDNPRIACIVSFYNPDVNINTQNRWASVTAVPVAQNVFKRLKLKDKDLSL